MNEILESAPILGGWWTKARTPSGQMVAARGRTQEEAEAKALQAGYCDDPPRSLDEPCFDESEEEEEASEHDA